MAYLVNKGRIFGRVRSMFLPLRAAIEEGISWNPNANPLNFSEK